MYFESIKSLNDLKSKYRELAFANHPDRGGDIDVMKAINAEYDNLYIRWNGHRATDSGYISPRASRAQFYRSEGWKGKNYESSRGVKEIAQLLRQYLKTYWKGIKFSIRIDGNAYYSEIRVVLVSAPFNPWADINSRDFQIMREEVKMNHFHDPLRDIESGHIQLNHFPDYRLSHAANVMLEDIETFLNSYNYDYSDAMTDYFDRGFYIHMAVGSYDKPFKQTGNMKMADTSELKFV